MAQAGAQGQQTGPELKILPLLVQLLFPDGVYVVQRERHSLSGLLPDVLHAVRSFQCLFLALHYLLQLEEQDNYCSLNLAPFFIVSFCLIYQTSLGCLRASSCAFTISCSSRNKDSSSYFLRLHPSTYFYGIFPSKTCSLRPYTSV